MLKTAMLEDMLDIVDMDKKREEGRPPELKVRISMVGEGVVGPSTPPSSSWTGWRF